MLLILFLVFCIKSVQLLEYAFDVQPFVLVFTITYTVQDDLLAREIFGEFVPEIQLANFILAILL